MKTGGVFLDVYANVKKSVGEEHTIIVVSTKVSKKAVVRNKIRRQIKEILRLPLINSRFAVNRVVVKSNIVGHSFDEIKKDIEQALYSL